MPDTAQHLARARSAAQKRPDEPRAGETAAQWSGRYAKPAAAKRAKTRPPTLPKLKCLEDDA